MTSNFSTRNEVNHMEALPRSPLLMSQNDTAMLVVDVQEKLIPAILDHERVVWNIRRLLDVAKILKVPVLGTEQYPKGLGNTIPELAAKMSELPSKVTFSCRECSELFTDLRSKNIYKILVVGIEAHVCVAQTVFDLMTAGFSVFVAVDAVGSRHSLDKEIAIKRMDSSGATITTTEAVLFEWCEKAGTPEFKQISSLVQEPFPEQA